MKCKKCGIELPENSAFCSGCGEKIVAEKKETVVETAPVNSAPVAAKKPFPIKLVLILVGVLVAIIAIVSIVIVVISNSAPREKVYLSADQMEVMYSSIKDYKKKYVKMGGEVYKVDYDKKGQTITMYTDEKLSHSVKVYYENKSLLLKNDDYVIIDGYIKSEDEVTNSVYIIADTVEKTDYTTAFAPAVKTAEVNKTVTQEGVTVTISKVEFAENETRVFMKVTNASNDEVSVYSGIANVTQNGKEFENTYSKSSVDLASNISPASSTEGVVVYPKMAQSNFSMKISAYSSNYEVNLDDFKIDLVIQ